MFLLALAGVTQAQPAPPPVSPDTALWRPAYGPADRGRSSVLLTVPLARDGSGTSWLPDAALQRDVQVRTRGWSVLGRGWMIRVRYDVFPRYLRQDLFDAGRRGDDRFGIPNWFQIAGSNLLGRRSQLGARGMVSLEPITVGSQGYPLLFQSGETFEGEPLIDRQRPLDFFVETALTFSYALSFNSGLYLYAALPGEPALGPPRYLYRSASGNNPNAPLGYQWRTAPLPSYGVITAGWQYGWAKIEASAFNGRIPDGDLWNIDRPDLNSYSARLSFNPHPYLAAQGSQGFLNRPQPLEPQVDVWKTSASLLYDRRFGLANHWAGALVGEWSNPTRGPSLQAYLLDNHLQWGDFAAYGRLQLVQKSDRELGLEDLDGRVFRVAALTLGAAQGIFSFGSFAVQVGAQGTVFRPEAELRPVYGDWPASAQVYLRLSPKLVFWSPLGRYILEPGQI
ncbi:MAG: hypothetical protein C4524_08960 [Candidatus Zixiibacteriota bacterium]|nr:MAG: hypothetical protein C4524_08960 [candidate division Zixibacteria bacterium]